MNILRINMIDAGNLLKELDDALDKVVPKKEPESFLRPSTLKIEEYQKSIRQIQAQFTDAPQFNETSAYPQFLSCGLLKLGEKMVLIWNFYCLKFILSLLKACI